MKKRVMTLVITAGLLLTACNNGAESTTESSVQSESSEVSSIETSEKTSSEETSSKETSSEESVTAEETISYMKQNKDIITDMQPTEIENARDSVKYAEFQRYTYYSTTAERDTGVNVLLPPDYSEDKEYPVMYILHGYYDNENWMTRDVVSIPTMLGNLVADGAAKEMIVVAPYIYCSKDMPYCTGMDLQNSLNYDNFINDLVTDLIPFIESTFSVAKGRENTAITGFSMGGRESLFIGFTRPELFGYIGAVCPAPGLSPIIPDSPTHPGQLDKSDLVFEKSVSPYVLLLSAAKNDGVVGSTPYTYSNMLKANKTEYLWHEISRGGHDHTSVKPHLYNFFRLVFKTN